jgi:hypothetical protein
MEFQQAGIPGSVSQLPWILAAIDRNASNILSGERLSSEQMAVTTGAIDVSDIGQVSLTAFSPDGRRFAIASEEGTARVGPIFPTTQDLVDYARAVMPRQLDENERKTFFLDPAPASGATPASLRSPP